MLNIKELKRKFEHALRIVFPSSGKQKRNSKYVNHLYELGANQINENNKNKEKELELSANFLNKDIDIDEYIYLSNKFQKPLKLNKNIEKAFINDKIIFPNIDGDFFVKRPFSHLYFSFLRSNFLDRVKRDELSKIQQHFQDILYNLKYVEALDSRQKVVEEFSSQLTTEKSIAFSQTPAILNPFEVINSEKNTEGTSLLVDSLIHSTKQIHFLVSESGIRKQISDQISNPNLNLSIDELYEKYLNRFKEYLLESKATINIYLSEDSIFNNPNLNLQLLNTKNAIVAMRDNNHKVNRGIIVHKYKVSSLMKKIIPKANLLSEIPAFENAFNFTIDSFDDIKENFISGNYKLKIEKTEQSIRNSLDSLFEK